MGQCPSGFNPRGQGCYATCPLNKGFVDVDREGSFSCGFRNSAGAIDNASLVIRQQTPLLPPATPAKPRSIQPTLQEVQKLYPEQYQRYKTELARFDQEISVISAKVDRQKLIDTAFRKLQAADAIKNKAPEAYIAAKKDYYTLTRGEGWIKEERKRIETNEVRPTLEQALTKYKDASSRAMMGGKLSQLLKDTKDRVTGVESEMRTSINMLGKQLRNVRDQLNLERHKTEQPVTTLPFVGYILNALLVIAILFAIWTVGSAVITQGKAPKMDKYYDDRY